MPRQCSVCTSVQRPAIDSALVANQSLRTIADQYGVSKTALIRHKSEHLPALLASAVVRNESDREADHATQPDHARALVAQVEQQASAQHGQAIDVLAELTESVAEIRRLRAACDEWLRDPDDPERYFIGPRGSDVTVMYWGIGRDGKPKRKKKTLDEALRCLEGGGTVTDGAEYKIADPRELLIKAITALNSQLSLFVAVMDRIHNAQEIERFEAAVLEAIGEAAPDVRDHIVAALRQRQPLLGPAR